IDGLSLEKLCPTGHFVLHTPEFRVPIWRARIDYGPDTKGRCALERLSTQVRTGLQRGHRLQQPEYVQVKDWLGVRMVSRPWGVTSHAHEIAHPQRRSPEQVGLQGQTIAVATGDLQHRFKTFLHQETRDGEWRHRHARAMRVGEVERMHHASEL